MRPLNPAQLALHMQALGVAYAGDLDAFHRDVREKHRQKIRQEHPDAGGDPEACVRANVARDVLLGASDALLRQATLTPGSRGASGPWTDDSSNWNFTEDDVAWDFSSRVDDWRKSRGSEPPPTIDPYHEGGLAHDRMLDDLGTLIERATELLGLETQGPAAGKAKYSLPHSGRRFLNSVLKKANGIHDHVMANRKCSPDQCVAVRNMLRGVNGWWARRRGPRRRRPK